MTRTRYGVSPWMDAQGRSTRAMPPRLTGEHDVPVAIVGGGLAGAATAYAFAAAGIRVVLIDADRVGGGATSRATGLIQADAAGAYLELESMLGRRAARAVWHGTRRASLELQATLRRLRIRSGLVPLEKVLYARAQDEERLTRRELQARKDAGIEATGVTRGALAASGISGATGIRTRGHAWADPVRICQGLARAAAARGAQIFERSPATRIRHTRTGAEVSTAHGVLRCGTVVIATGEPGRDFRALSRHLDARTAHAVLTPPLPAPIRRALPKHDLLIEDLDAPHHRLVWTADNRILWSGGDEPRLPERSRASATVQRTGQMMYELSLTVEPISGILPEYGWDAPYSTTADGVPFIGPHRNYPHHLFAFGLHTNLANAFLASRILLRHYTGAAERDDEVFGFARLAALRASRS